MSSEGFVVGGVVPIGNPTYRDRPFELECFRLLGSRDWVTLLGPRQHGKTSALVRLEAQLGEQGVRAAVVDFQAYPAPVGEGLSTFLSWLVAQVRRSFGLDVVDAGGVDTVEEALSRACEGIDGSIALLFDEAARLPPVVRHDFYSQLRAFHSATRRGAAIDLGSRLVFLFAGTFRPDSIIDDDNSPFNVSRLVLTEDLTRDQVLGLVGASGDDTLLEWVDRVYSIVGGMPYLLQALLDALASSAPGDREVAFEREVQRLISGQDGHLPALYRRLAAEAGAEDRLRSVITSGAAGTPTSGDGIDQFLEVVGAVSSKTTATGATRLFVRNALYCRAFEASPRLNAAAILDRPGGGGGVIPPPVLAPLPPDALDWVVDAELRGVIEELHAAGVDAGNAGHWRLALAGLGGVLEGVFLAMVEQMDSAAREAARLSTTLGNGDVPKGDCAKWTLEALSGVLQTAGMVPQLPGPAADMLRGWRNLVHPNRARGEYKPEAQLQPLVAIMSACITMVLAGPS